MNEKKTILIAGCGYVGTVLAEKLYNLGFNIDAIRRSVCNSSKYFNQINLDLTKPFQLSKQYSYVFYLASADDYNAVKYDQAYSLGVSNLLEALKLWEKPTRLIFVSSTSVYPQLNGEWVNEKSPVSSDGFARNSLLRGENLVLESEIPAIVVRFSGIYGPNRMSFKDSVLLKQKGLLEKSFYTNRIHRDDCVESLIHLINKGNTGEVYIASDSDPADYNDVINWICNKAGIDAIKLPSQENVSMHRGNKRCSNKKLIETGYKFLYPSFKFGYI